MILAYTVFNLPFAVWILRDFFAGLPVDLEESALIDGATRFQSFRKIVLPLAAPGLIAAFLFCLVFTWNDYLFALMLTFSKASTLPMFIAGEGTQSYGPQWWYLSALSLLSIAPMILITARRTLHHARPCGRRDQMSHAQRATLSERRSLRVTNLSKAGRASPATQTTCHPEERLPMAQ
jgi:multiple sugar transport system permease protein